MVFLSHEDQEMWSSVKKGVFLLKQDPFTYIPQFIFHLMGFTVVIAIFVTIVSLPVLYFLQKGGMESLLRSTPANLFGIALVALWIMAALARTGGWRPEEKREAK